MNNNFSDVSQSYRVANQAPLDAKNFVENLANFVSYVLNNPGSIFNFYEGMIIYVYDSKKRYEWVLSTSDNQSLSKVLPNDITYPNGSVFNGIDYSNKTYNFFEYQVSGAQGPQGPQGIPGDSQILNVSGTSLVVLEAVIPFTYDQLSNNAFELNHNLDIYRFIEEHIAYPPEAHSLNNVVTYTPGELKNEGIIQEYGVVDRNNILLKDFQVALNTNEVSELYYYVKYVPNPPLNSLIPYRVEIFIGTCADVGTIGSLTRVNLFISKIRQDVLDGNADLEDGDVLYLDEEFNNVYDGNDSDYVYLDNDSLPFGFTISSLGVVSLKTSC